jgi:hypothetical protein
MTRIEKPAIEYVRVSTKQQGKSDLGQGHPGRQHQAGMIPPPDIP